MMKAVLIVGAIGAALTAFACSSSSNGSADNSCFESSGAPAACVSCDESHCNVSALESACSDLIKCECPNGTYSQTAAANCTSQEMESSCQSAVQTFSACEQQNCASQCNSSSSSSSGSTSSSSGSTSSSSGSSSGGGSGSCSSLATCCGMLPSADQASCNTIVSANNQTECQSALSSYMAGNLCQ